MMLGDDAQTVGHDAGYTLGWAPRCPLDWRRGGRGGEELFSLTHLFFKVGKLTRGSWKGEEKFEGNWRTGHKMST